MALHYRFQSGAREWRKIPLDGRVMTVIDVKRAIVEKEHLLKQQDEFDLLLKNVQTGEVYREDNDLIHKNTSVIVRRIPASKTSNLVIRLAATKPTTESQSVAIDGSGGTSQMEQPKQQMAQSTSISSLSAEDQRLQKLVEQSHGLGYDLARNVSTGNDKYKSRPQRKKLRSGYICHRCSKPGHFIQDCPTNGNKAFDPKVPVTGIPKSSLAQLSDSTELVLIPDDAAFAQAVLKTESIQSGVPRALLCNICDRVMKLPTATPCCYSSFCEECIRQMLTSTEELKCPVCAETGVSPDELLPNKRLEDLIERDYAEELEQSRSEKPVPVKDVAVATPNATDAIAVESNGNHSKDRVESPAHSRSPPRRKRSRDRRSRPRSRSKRHRSRRYR